MQENVHLSQNATKTPTVPQKVKFSHILRQMPSFVFFCDKMHSFLLNYAKLTRFVSFLTQNLPCWLIYGTLEA